MSLNIQHDLSLIKELLSHKGGSFLYRQVLILAGDEEWQKEFLLEILSGHEDKSLWVGEKAPEEFPFVETKKAPGWLGNEKRVVIFDANKDFDPDSFAAISGIVIGGGLFFLLLPEKEQWNKLYSSHFGQRTIQSINNHPDFIIINKNNDKFKFSLNNTELTYPQNCVAPFLTIDQQCAVESIEEQILGETDNPVVLISDRGRGKSAALGIVITKLVQAGIKNIAITAPRLRTTSIVFKHIEELLPEAEVSRGYVKYKKTSIQFYSPDQLIHDDIEADILFIDEAAAIPVPLLTSFLHKYSQCVFATTVHGYEGTGRGFSLRFFKELDKYNSNWIKLHMQTPVRWAENDPLEKWMFSLLCLGAEIIDVPGEIELNKVECFFLEKEQLVDDELLLKEVFSLLVLAHYRTRPKDLMNLLDDDNISVYVSLHNKHVIAVALVVREGSFPASLSTEVYRGKRRPQGHLLAQALTYHCGVEHAATLDYARVMRIAVHPELQGKGIGTRLLNFIINREKHHGRDAIGTSFGMTVNLLKFWEKLKFNLIRIGFTREQTSGEYAAIMLLPLTEKGEKVNQEAHERFNEQLPLWFDDVLKDIPSAIKDGFQFANKEPLKLTKFYEKDLKSFSYYSRNYELCIAALNKFVMMRHDDIVKDNFPEDFRQVLNSKIINKISWKDIGKKMGLSGQNEARKLFHSAILYLIKIAGY